MCGGALPGTVEGMNTNNASSSPLTRQPLPWLLILGLSSLALLWPLTALWELGQGAPRALTILGITGAAWIGVVGFGRVQRPVLTLTVVGLLHTFLSLVLAGFFAGSGGPTGDPVTWWIALPSLATSGGVGALAGLAALGVQRAIGSRPDAPTPSDKDL